MYRQYDPETARWLSEDPLFVHDSSAERSPNLYDYVQNNPLRRIDPLGLVQWNCDYVLGSISDPVGFAVFQAKCVSSCGPDNKQVVAVVGAHLATFSGGSPITLVKSKATLEDRQATADANNLVGWTFLAGFGAALGPGKSWTALKLGKAEVPDANRWGSQTGIDLSIGGHGGYSYLMRSSKQNCCSK
jgi:hypothetical protein